MPAHKRKLSVSEAAAATSSGSEKKQRYSTSLLFKPSIQGSSKQPKAFKSEQAEVAFDSEENSNSNGSLVDNQDAPRLPKLSIKRTVNRDSNESEFTIETKDVNNEADDDDDGEESSEENEELSDGEDEDEDEMEEIDEQEDEEEDEDSYEEEEDVNKPPIKLKIKNIQNKEEFFDEQEEEEEGEDDEETDEEEEDNEEPMSKKQIQPRRGRPPKTRNDQFDEQQANISLKIKGKRGRKPGYRKYPSEDAATAASEKPTQSTKTPRAITSYFLFCQVNRPKIAEKNPELKLRQQQRIVSDMWNKLTDKERLIWRQKAVKLRKKGSKGMISTGVIPQPAIRKVGAPRKGTASLKLDSKIEPTLVAATTATAEVENEKTVPYPASLANFIDDCRPIDLAAYLTILGESMTTFGNNILKLHESKVAVQGASFVLLDAFLCALGPLFCLTTQVEEMDACSKETIMKILDNISHLMPGS